MKTLKKSSTIPHDEVWLKYLRDLKRANYAIKLALKEFDQDNDVDMLLNVLRLVAQAQGGLASLARKTDVSRQALHEALSPQGNPRLRTFQNVLGSLGLRMTVKPVRAPVKRVSRSAA
ncbi:MAG TPA: transcriptional regulator [Verrucomicrobiales bacterium]|nr:transcriptional regulator [Verrucomicrobiales bacterium]